MRSVSGISRFSLFLSHAHEDKHAARSVMRYLTAHGVHAWLDERELRLGVELDGAIRRHIDEADAVVVVASNAAANSTWVARECDLARELGKSITPIFIEDVKSYERFRDYLGIDAIHLASFANAVYSLLESLAPATDEGGRKIDLEALRCELVRLAEEVPELAPLVHGCLDPQGPGLHQDNMETVKRAPFHSLDFALNSLHELAISEQSAWHAAYGFRWSGAGVRALASWIRSSRGGGGPLITAVGDVLKPALIDAAIELLRQCDPPNNQALYSFIAANASALSTKQVAAVMGLVTWPVRGIDQFGDVLGWVAWRDLPPAPELPRMWRRWIESGAFDEDCEGLARYVKDAAEANLLGVNDVIESMRRHARAQARSGEKKKVWASLRHLRAAADHDAPTLGVILREVSGATGTYEWKAWEERSREEAEEMACQVRAHVDAATGDHDWLEARKRAKQDLENRREVEQMMEDLRTEGER